jgi:hypothetical protein
VRSSSFPEIRPARGGRLGRVLAGGAAVLLAGGLLSACTATPYAAVVDGRVISQSRLDSELSAIVHNAGYLKQISTSEKVRGAGSGTYSASFVAAVLNQDVQLAVVAHAVAARHLRITAAERTQATADLDSAYGGAATFDAFPAAYRARLLRAFADVTALEASLVGANLSSAHLKALYAADPSRYGTICTSEALFSSNAAARTAARSLAHGASFDKAVAAAKAAGTLGGEGVVGCGTRAEYQGSFSKAVATAVGRTATGSATGVVSTSQGPAIFDVTARHNGTYAASARQIVASLLSSAGGRLQRYIDHELEVTPIEVNPADGRLVRVKGVPEVETPSGPSKAATSGFLAGA